jgi:hypothetical protein
MEGGARALGACGIEQGGDHSMKELEMVQGTHQPWEIERKERLGKEKMAGRRKEDALASREKRPGVGGVIFFQGCAARPGDEHRLEKKKSRTTDDWKRSGRWDIFLFFVLPKISDNSIHDSFSDVYGVDNNCDMILFSWT